MLTTIPESVMSELERAVEQATLDLRDAKAIADACERMDRAREELSRRRGELNVSVELIREARDEA
jgi:hypothetical protein